MIFVVLRWKINIPCLKCSLSQTRIDEFWPAFLCGGEKPGRNVVIGVALLSALATLPCRLTMHHCLHHPPHGGAARGIFSDPTATAMTLLTQSTDNQNLHSFSPAGNGYVSCFNFWRQARCTGTGRGGVVTIRGGGGRGGKPLIVGRLINQTEQKIDPAAVEVNGMFRVMTLLPTNKGKVLRFYFQQLLCVVSNSIPDQWTGMTIYTAVQLTNLLFPLVVFL